MHELIGLKSFLLEKTSLHFTFKQPIQVNVDLGRRKYQVGFRRGSDKRRMSKLKNENRLGAHDSVKWH